MARNAKTHQYQGNTNDIANPNIAERRFPLPNFEHLRRLPAKGRKGREATQETREDEKPALRTEMHPLKQPPEQPNQQRPQQIDGQGPSRKIMAADSLRQDKNSMPTDRANPPA